MIHGVRNIHVLAAGTALLLAGCGSAGQNFSEVTGDLRIRGNVAASAIEPQKRVLSLNLASVQNGRPVDAVDVEVKPAAAHAIHAVRERRGSYKASFADTRHVDVLIIMRDRMAVIALQRQ